MDEILASWGQETGFPSIAQSQATHTEDRSLRLASEGKRGQGRENQEEKKNSVARGSGLCLLLLKIRTREGKKENSVNSVSTQETKKVVYSLDLLCLQLPRCGQAGSVQLCTKGWVRPVRVGLGGWRGVGVASTQPGLDRKEASKETEGVRCV